MNDNGSFEQRRAQRDHQHATDKRALAPHRAKWVRRAAAATIGTLLASSMLLTTPASAVSTTFPVTSRVSVTTSGEQAPATSKSSERVLTDGSGRYVFFSTSAALQPDDTNGTRDVYLRDRVAGTTTRVSVDEEEDELVDGPADLCGLSTDGRFVGYAAPATGTDDVNKEQVWIRDRVQGHTQVVSVSSNEILAGSGGLSGIAYPQPCPISDDGRYVTFVSSAPGIVASDVDGLSDAFRRDRTAGTTTLVSVSSGAVKANAEVRWASMSDDGAKVSFISGANNLVAGDTNGKLDVFVRNVPAQTTARVNLTDDDAQTTDGDSRYGVISGNGLYVAFESKASGLTAEEEGTFDDVYVRDLNAASTELISQTTGSVQANGYSQYPAISDDGRFVTFSSSAKNLYPVKVNVTADAFLRDRQVGRTDLVSRTSSIATGNANTIVGAAISNDGKRAAFISEASNLVRNDTNGIRDVFVRDFAVDTNPFTSFDLLVKQQFADFVGRQPTSAELTEWRARLVNGELGPDGVIDALAHGPEWSAKRAPLTRLYWAFFLRTPDLGGMNYWTNQLTNGKSLAAVAKQFSTSGEFQTKYGSKTNSEFVTLIYQNIFDRDPDPGGLAFWTNKLDTNQKTRGDVMVSFSESNEGKRVLAPQTDTVLLWLGMLRVMPPKASFITAVSAMKVGAPPEALAEFLRTGTDYAARL